MFCFFREEKKKKKHKQVVESNINSHDPSLSPTSFFSDLSKEKKKKKPILPAPPPLADISEPEKLSEKQVSPPLENDVTVLKEKAPDINEPQPSVQSSSPPSTKKPPSPSPPPKSTKSKLIWSGSISMLELSTFKANVYPVSDCDVIVVVLLSESDWHFEQVNGCCDNLDIDLPVRLVLGGRIHPRVVWEYLGKISVLPNKQLSVVRFHAASDDDRVGYVAMLSYFSSRKRSASNCPTCPATSHLLLFQIWRGQQPGPDAGQRHVSSSSPRVSLSSGRTHSLLPRHRAKPPLQSTLHVDRHCGATNSRKTPQIDVSITSHSMLPPASTTF